MQNALVLPLMQVRPRGWLREFLLRHRRRIVLSALLGLFGSALLYLGISHFEVGAWQTNAFLSLPMAVLSYFANYYLVWYDRQSKLLPGLIAWSGKWAITAPASQGIFYLVVVSWGCPYMAGKVIAAVLIGPLSYTASNLIIFNRERLEKLQAWLRSWTSAGFRFPETSKAEKA